MPTLRIQDAELCYEESGQGEPVVLLHGLGSSGADWAPQVAALAPHYRVILPDTRGSGRSRDLQHPGGPFSIRQFAADVAALLDHLGTGPAHVVGLSMGGMIAFQLAVDSPRHLRTLTIINSGPAVVPRSLPERAGLLLRSLITNLFGPAHMGKLLAPKLFPGPEQEALRQTFRERMAHNDKRAYAATLRAIIGWSVLDRIGEIQAPTLVVASDLDYTPVAAKQAYVRLMPRAELVVVEGARHALPIEAPAKFNPILAAFLARHAS